jgi:hypothetical protein
MSLILGLAYVVVGAFPGTVNPGSAVLDGAWILEINRLVAGSFGRDLAFTYGPLGFLLYPATSAMHVVLALVLRAATLAGLAAWIFTRGQLVDQVLCALAQVASVRLGLTFEYQVLVPVTLLALRSLQDPPAAAARSAAVAVLAAVGLFVKFSLGAAVVAVVLSSQAIRLLRDRRRSLRAIWMAAAAGGIALLLLSTSFLASPGDLVPWLGRSLELASGYTQAMSLTSTAPGRSAITVAAAGAVVALLVLGVWGAWHRSAPATLALLLAAPAFMAFKHAFVREDLWHTPLFFPFLLSGAGAGALLARAGAERVLARTLVAATLVLSVLVATSYRLVDRPGEALASALTGADGARALRGWLSLEARQNDLARARATDSPPRLAEVAAGRRVGVIPFKLGFCAAAGISCTPSPTLQTFAAYTPGLDAWSAEHYLGARAPPLLMLHLDGIDGRMPAFDSPALWRALLAAYRTSSTQVGGALLLEQVASPIRPVLVEFETTTILPGKWVSIPGHPEARHVAVALRSTWLGRLRSVLYRSGPVYLALGYASGESVAIRLVPATAQAGLPIDELARSPVDLFALFSGQALPRPVALALFGDGLSDYQTPVSLTWLRANRPTEPR